MLDQTVEGDCVYNRSSVSVWVNCGGKAVEIPAGQTVKL